LIQTLPIVFELCRRTIYHSAMTSSVYKALEGKIKAFFKGDIADDKATLTTYSRDASFFQVCPEMVLFPKDVKDIRALVNFVTQQKKDGLDISITARSA